MARRRRAERARSSAATNFGRQSAFACGIEVDVRGPTQVGMED
jgi:hypothetical protein